MSIPLDTESRADDVTDAITRLVIAGGLRRVTMRAVAGGVGISGTLAGHLTNRPRIRGSVGLWIAIRAATAEPADL